MRVRLIGLTLALLACDPSLPSWGGEEGDGDGDGSNPGDGWLVLGQGELAFVEIVEGDELVMVLGGQGLLMFPIPLHAGGFPLPPDPGDHTHPDAPVLDIHLDIDGFNDGFGGHFARVANYPIPFEILEGGTFEFRYVTIFVPDELANPCDVDEAAGHLHAELETADDQVLVVDLDVSIEVPETLGAGCEP